MEYSERLQVAAEYVRAKITSVPKIAIILGSGLGDLAENLSDSVVIPYEEIPEFPVSTVHGHKSRLVIGKLGNKEVMCMQGRFHFYEGYDIRDVVFPIRMMKLLGIERLLVTNAAGGVNAEFEPGTLMLIRDHINFAGINPLMGKNMDDFGTRFPDMSFAYDPELIRISKDVAGELDIDIKEGVYVWMTGPSYETPAEIKMCSIIGGDAVGMSTVPEVIVANHQGMKVLGISFITNLAAGIQKTPLNHDEVIEITEKKKHVFQGLVSRIIEVI